MADTTNHRRTGQKERKADVSKANEIVQMNFRLQSLRNAFVLNDQITLLISMMLLQQG